MIRVLVLDIDGVLSDGHFYLDETGQECKRFFYRDLDALTQAHRAGIMLALVTGEDTPMVDALAKRLNITRVYRGAKDKVNAIHQLARDAEVDVGEICYIGDSPRDALALSVVGLGVAPRDAHPSARQAARLVLASCGGTGAVEEIVECLLEDRADCVGQEE